MAYMRDAIQKRLDEEDGKLCEEKTEYVTTSNLKEKIEEILENPINSTYQNNIHQIALSNLMLNALDDPAVIQKLREKLKELKIDVNHQRKE